MTLFLYAIVLLRTVFMILLELYISEITCTAF
jgi:hypothetical protein